MTSLISCCYKPYPYLSASLTDSSILSAHWNQSTNISKIALIMSLPHPHFHLIICNHLSRYYALLLSPPVPLKRRLCLPAGLHAKTWRSKSGCARDLGWGLSILYNMLGIPLYYSAIFMGSRILSPYSTHVLSRCVVTLMLLYNFPVTKLMWNLVDWTRAYAPRCEF